MRYWSAVILVAALNTLSFAVLTVQDKGKPIRDNRNVILERILSAQDASEKSNRNDELFTSLDDKALEGMLANENDEIAIRSAWEQVRRCVKHHPNVRGNSLQVSLNVHTFLGFVKGRFKLSP